jgi:hypothetical protein
MTVALGRSQWRPGPFSRLVQNLDCPPTNKGSADDAPERRPLQNPPNGGYVVKTFAVRSMRRNALRRQLAKLSCPSVRCPTSPNRRVW